MAVIASVLLLIAALPHPAGVEEGKGADDAPVRGLRLHGAIRINGDEEFAAIAASEGWPGNGTAENPYIIEQYLIDAGGEGDCIYIGNTTVHFIVRHYYLQKGRGVSLPFYSGSGVALYNVINGTVENNTCMDNTCGITIYYGRACRVANNTCVENSVYGIHVEFSGIPYEVFYQGTGGGGICCSIGHLAFPCVFRSMDDGEQHTHSTPSATSGAPIRAAWEPEDPSNTVANNTCSGSRYGIHVEDSTNTIIVLNRCTGNIYGIYLWHSWRNTVRGNECTNNRIGIMAASSDGNTFENNLCESSKMDMESRGALPMYFIPYGCGMVLDSSSYSTVRNNICRDNTADGIHLRDSHHNLLADNTCSGCDSGIYLFHTTHNRIYGNTMKGCGIMISGGFDTFTTQEIPANNTVNGKPVYYYRNANLQYASVPINAGQVILGNVVELKIKNLFIENSTVGILVGYSSHILITGNTLSHNTWCVYLWTATEITVGGNICSQSYTGVVALYSEDITAEYNLFTRNYEGCTLYYSSKCTVAHNLCYRNSYGIVLRDSENVKVADNSCVGNDIYGILISGSYYNYVENNICDNNEYGMLLRHSSRNIIWGNILSNNTAYGIYISSGSYNRIYSNTFWYNNGANDTYNSSHIQAYDDGTKNWWNSTSGYGNFWNDWAYNNDTNDHNWDGIVDWPYMIDGDAGAMDHHPIAAPNTTPVEWYLFWISSAVVAAVALFALVRRRRRK